MRGRRNRITLPRYGHRTTVRRAPSRTPPFCALAEVLPVMLERVVEDLFNAGVRFVHMSEEDDEP